MVKYKLTVDEPWGFNHNGSNILHGIVIKQLSPTFLLFKSDSFLDFNGQKSCILILKPRYEKEYLKQHYKPSSLLRPAALRGVLQRKI